LAKAVWKMIELDIVSASNDSKHTHDSRIHHWTDAGTASWYDFAIAIQEEATSLGLLKKDLPCYIKPIRTEDYPTPAIRPAYSQLDKTNTWHALATKPRHWRQALRTMLKEIETHV
ncbi:MAG: sugar nucleotide-binding protein, partial [Thiohalomonadales bacterium]